MATSVFGNVDTHSEINQTQHRTSEILAEQLVLRRGQPFILTLELKSPFISDLNPLILTAVTGQQPEEERGTMSCFGIPDVVKRSPSAKAVWKAEEEGTSSLMLGRLTLKITPPADAPIGQYHLKAKLKDQEALLVTCVLLYNPWCPDDWVFLPDEEERQEYVMNEQGVIFVGSDRYISSRSWDFGQFEENMVNICLVLLDLNHKHEADPADDVSARCNPIYVSRVVSAMINSEDDRGVLKGNWGDRFVGGVPPSHWNGSHKILKQWYNIGCYPVKYGQCWVFAGVMCSVMRLLGIPCRVVTNYQSAHDNNANLIIDVFHADYGVRERPSPDSIWNYHVWVEGWMKRPDLSEDGKYDGWQVLDPTPQEKSDGIYCCGPASVKAILDGETDLKYDIPFVFAEVNADCIDWLVKKDGSKVSISSNTKRVGHNISTKSVGSKKRVNITDSYKHREGTEKEREIFELASAKNLAKIEREKKEKEEKIVAEENESEGTPDGENRGENGSTGTTDGENTEENRNGGTSDGENIEENGNGGTPAEENGVGNGSVTTPDVETPSSDPPPAPLLLRFEEVSRPTNGEDVELRLVVGSDSPLSRTLTFLISVHGMLYTGTPYVNIQTEVTDRTLLPGKELSIPIVVPFSAYHRHMVVCDSMKVSAIATDKRDPGSVFLAEDDVVLLDPPLSISIMGYTRLYREAVAEVVFNNPVDELLEECTLSLVGSGLLRDECEFSVPNLRPSCRVRIQVPFVPYRTGVKTLMANFKCSTFSDIKSSISVVVTV